MYTQFATIYIYDKHYKNYIYIHYKHYGRFIFILSRCIANFFLNTSTQNCKILKL